MIKQHIIKYQFRYLAIAYLIFAITLAVTTTSIFMGWLAFIGLVGAVTFATLAFGVNRHE